jgi:DNA-binding CsgD family transcriptional regulator
MVEALTLAGRVDEAVGLGKDLVARLPPAQAAAVHLRLAGAAITAAKWDLAGHQIAAVRRLVDAGESPQLRAELALRDGELAIGTGDGERAETLADAALDLARRDQLPEIECAAMQLLGRCARVSSLAAAEAWFRHALATAESHGLALWRLRALHEVGTIALLERSNVDALLAAQSLAETLGAMATAAILDVEIAAGYNGLHDLSGQRRHGLEAVRRGTELGLDLVVAYGWQHVAVASAFAGDREQVESAKAAARAAAPGNRDVDGLLVGACEVAAALNATDNDRALRAAEQCAELLRGSSTAPPMHLRAAWPLLLAIDHRDGAPAALDELERAGVSVNRACRGGLTMARAVIAGWDDPHRASVLAVEADVQLADVPWWRHVVRRLAAGAATADGWTVPEGWMVESEQWLRRQGYGQLADACAALRPEHPSRVPPAWARMGITAREGDVLALVIEGHSNRAVADELHLSVRTVEKHVESLLRKTGTRSRTQLARAAATT